MYEVALVEVKEFQLVILGAYYYLAGGIPLNILNRHVHQRGWNSRRQKSISILVKGHESVLGA